MHRKHTKYGIHNAFDLIGLSAAWVIARQLRGLAMPYVNSELARQDASAANIPLLLVLALWIVAGLWTGGWKPAYRRFHDLAPLAESVVLSSCLLIVTVFVFHLFGRDLSSVLVLLLIPVSLPCIVTARSITAFVTGWIDVNWPSPERVAVLGSSEDACQVVDRIRNSGRKVSVAGLILPSGARSSGNGGTFPVLGTTSALASVINGKRLDRIIMLDGCASEEELERCSAVSKRMGVVFSRAIKASAPFANVALVERFGLSLLDERPVAFTRRQELVKRFFDVIACSALMLAVAPVLFAIGVIIKLTSNGPVLYRAPRVGRGGRHFTCLKFRSMYVDGARREVLSDDGRSGHIFKLRRDPRITAWGRVLRKYSLDELPQLFNVLRGDMSLVGPRPLPAEDLDPDGQSRKFESWSEGRSRVLPGITGMWQICGRSDVPFEKMIELDIAYIREWSLALDLRILLRTPVVVITGKGAY